MASRRRRRAGISVEGTQGRRVQTGARRDEERQLGLVAQDRRRGVDLAVADAVQHGMAQLHVLVAVHGSTQRDFLVGAAREVAVAHRVHALLGGDAQILDGRRLLDAAAAGGVQDLHHRGMHGSTGRSNDVEHTRDELLPPALAALLRGRGLGHGLLALRLELGGARARVFDFYFEGRGRLGRGRGEG